MEESKNNLTPIGKEIKRKMISNEISHLQLAEDIGISPSYLSQILYGHRPGKNYIYMIGRILNIDVNKYVA